MSKQCGGGSNYPSAGCYYRRQKDSSPKVGTEGYDATVAVMDLYAMHGDDVLAPLNVTTHDFLELLKEAAGMTMIPSPTVEHSLSEVLNKINGTSPSKDRGREDGSSTTTNITHATTAAAVTIIVNEQLTTAESAPPTSNSCVQSLRARVVENTHDRCIAKATQQQP